MASMDKISLASSKHPKPEGAVFQYGTSGFRMNAQLLDPVVFRIGLLASLRSRLYNGEAVGIMITASHNPPEDNGIKLVDPMGEMLETAWEEHGTTLANATDDAALVEAYEFIAKKMQINLKNPAKAIFARDTRVSGPALVKTLLESLEACDVQFQDFGMATTPQLHYLTRAINTEGKPDSFGEPTVEGYYKKMSKAFVTLIEYKKPNGPLIVDCANGIGGPKLKELLKYIPTAAEGGVDIKVVNDDTVNPEKLNYQCGADYVKTRQRPPPSLGSQHNTRLCSLDGDADRLIYYYVSSVPGRARDPRFLLLDGDRIAILAATIIEGQLKLAGLHEKLSMGVVQTAYANGSSTRYIERSLRLQVVCTPTGVKHLHHAATRFDIGVYFESNGHGTVVFSHKALKALRKIDPQTPSQRSALEYLTCLTQLINQTVGDALSDLLLVEALLAQKAWTMPDWHNTYVDLPNLLLAMPVRDRNLFVSTDAERRLLEPKGLQDEIDKLLAKYSDARCFVRKSGTEDVVRVYAEAMSRIECEDLINRVRNMINRV